MILGVCFFGYYFCCFCFVLVMFVFALYKMNCSGGGGGGVKRFFFQNASEKLSISSQVHSQQKY